MYAQSKEGNAPMYAQPKEGNAPMYAQLKEGNAPVYAQSKEGNAPERQRGFPCEDIGLSTHFICKDRNVDFM